MLLDELMIQNQNGKVWRKTFRHGKGLVKYAKKFNGKCNLFGSVYTFTNTFRNDRNRMQPCDPIVDKIYLDFDVKDDPNFPKYARTVAKYLHDNDISFYIRFSGRGFHIYIQIEQRELKNPAMAIRNWVATLHKDTDTESDSSVVGDLSRVSRLLHFINLKSGRYCIPIKYDELMNKLSELTNKYGDKIFNNDLTTIIIAYAYLNQDYSILDRYFSNPNRYIERILLNGYIWNHSFM